MPADPPGALGGNQATDQSNVAYVKLELPGWLPASGRGRATRVELASCRSAAPVKTKVLTEVFK